MRKNPDVPFEDLSRQEETGELIPVKSRGRVVRCAKRMAHNRDEMHFIRRSNDGDFPSQQ